MLLITQGGWGAVEKSRKTFSRGEKRVGDSESKDTFPTGV